MRLSQLIQQLEERQYFDDPEVQLEDVSTGATYDVESVEAKGIIVVTFNDTGA